MQNKKTLLVILLVFVLLLGGAYVLYNRLSPLLTANPLLVQPAESQPAADSPAQTDAASPAASQEAASTPSSAAEEQTQAPDFTVYDADGNEVHLSDYFGKPIVLNFWASWCGPCQMEMPDFEDKYRELGEDVQFLMVNMTDGSRETVDAASDFIAQQGYTFPVLYDTASDAATTYGVYALPTTYFIDGDGYAVARASGAIDSDTLQQGLDLIYPQ